MTSHRKVQKNSASAYGTSIGTIDYLKKKSL